MNKEQTNNKLFQDSNGGKCFHCREMIERFIKTKPQIRSLSFVQSQNENEEAIDTEDITFSVFMDDMGFDRETYIKYEKEFFSTFMIDFLGEFLVRENISQFVELTSKLEAQDYIEAISSKTHRKFGVTVLGNVAKFKFHISLLPRILTEELRSLDW